jgi:hypothetical protein
MLTLTTHPLAGDRTYLAFGAGAVRAYDASSALRFQIGAGRTFARSRFDASVLAERPVGRDREERDAVDLVTGLGWMHAVGSRVHLGVEALGQDLEGFWDTQEAEGGARLFVGPSGSVTAGQWQLGLAAGPVVHASNSDRTLPAERPLPTSGGRVGVSIRTMITRTW